MNSITAIQGVTIFCDDVMVKPNLYIWHRLLIFHEVLNIVCTLPCARAPGRQHSKYKDWRWPRH